MHYPFFLLRVIGFITKLLAWVIVVALVLVVSVLVAVYLPPVQRFAVGKASTLLAEKTGMQVSVERFRLRFPLRVSLRGTTVVSPAGDTLVRADRVTTGVSLRRLRQHLVRARSIVIVGADVRIPDSAGADSLPSEPRNEGLIPVLDWSFDVGRIDISDSRLSVAGLDFEQVGLEARDVVYRDGAVEVDLRDLTLRDGRWGLVLEGASGRLQASSTEFAVEDFSARTARSHFSLTARAGSQIVSLDSATPVDIALDGAVSAEDVSSFVETRQPVAAPSGGLKQVSPLLGDVLNFNVSLNGHLSRLTLDRFTAELPDHLRVTARGVVEDVLTPALIKGSADVDADLADIGFVTAFLPDTTRIVIPQNMTLAAVGDFTARSFDVENLSLVADGGRIVARGQVDLERQGYSVSARVLNFPVGDFLPRDSLGVVTLFATVRGAGFDPVGGMRARARIDVRRLDWKSYDLHDVTLSASVDGGRFEADVSSANELLSMELSAAGLLSREHTEAWVRTGDLSVDIFSPLPIDSLVRASTMVNTEVRRQLGARHFSADSLQSAFPDIRLTARAGRQNFLSEIARASGVDFAELRADVSTVEGSRFEVDARVTGFTAAKVVLDTISFMARRNGAALDYGLRMAGRRSRNALVGDHLGLVEVSGSVGGNELSVDVLQQNRRGETGFRFGALATLRDSVLNVRMTPLDPVLAYEQWTVDGAGMGGDWLEVGLDGALRADLQLTGTTPGEYINLSSATLADTPDAALRLDAAGLDIAAALGLFPTMPQSFGGLFFSDATFGLLREEGRRNIVAIGSVGVEGLSYGGRRVADVEAQVDFQSGASGAMELEANLLLDRTVGISAKGTYIGEQMDFALDIPQFPLRLVEGFVPSEAGVRFAGNLDGHVGVRGTAAEPLLAGEVGFVDASAYVGMTGTTLRISPERITLDGRTLAFNDIGIIAPNNRKLTLGGTFDLTDTGRPRADMTIRTDNFQLVNSTHIGGSQVYGNAAFDADITLRGPLSSLSVRGDVDLLSSTDIVYIMRNRSRVRDEKQHIVEFVEFADSLYTAAPDVAAVTGLKPRIDMLVGVNIADGLEATLSLDEQNENRVELIGGGDLTFSMNTQGDVRLSGRYELSGGTVYYRPPMIAQKVFAVQRGSYVEWTGTAANPEFHVSATQSMEVELTYDDGPGEQVDFDISVDISGTLGRMDMRFDLAAPSNLAIQNQLLGMDAEERMRQSLTLLLYGQYTGPGVSSKGASFDARRQIADFISREVNQWARNNLRGVDFSMGIDRRTDGISGGTHTDYSYSVSKSLFSDRVKLSVGGSVSDNATGDNFAGNLLEDVSLEYRINDRGTMLLKLYHYNTRESILEGEVTETGGGFIMRKKVNKIGDIFKRKMKNEK